MRYVASLLLILAVVLFTPPGHAQQPEATLGTTSLYETIDGQPVPLEGSAKAEGEVSQIEAFGNDGYQPAVWNPVVNTNPPFGASVADDPFVEAERTLAEVRTQIRRTKQALALYEHTEQLLVEILNERQDE